MGTIISPLKSAVGAVRAVLADIVPTSVMARNLTDTDLEWMLGIGLGGWIAARASTAVLQGQTIEGAILASNKRALDLGTIATILPRLGELDFPWSKPVGDWSRDDITGLILASIHLTETAEKSLKKAMPSLADDMNDAIPFE